MKRDFKPISEIMEELSQKAMDESITEALSRDRFYYEEQIVKWWEFNNIDLKLVKVEKELIRKCQEHSNVEMAVLVIISNNGEILKSEFGKPGTPTRCEPPMMISHTPDEISILIHYHPDPNLIFNSNVDYSTCSQLFNNNQLDFAFAISFQNRKYIYSKILYNNFKPYDEIVIDKEYKNKDLTKPGTNMRRDRNPEK